MQTAAGRIFFRARWVFATQVSLFPQPTLTTVTRDRRAALDGLSKILDAGAPEELFTGPEDQAVFLYDLLVETTRARSSTFYWEICRTARRRGVTPEYVVDRAVVLLAAMTERRRTDLYRILGVPPLASGEMIRQRWLDVAKRHHPDAGGDGAVFRHAKQAYEVLRDPDRRAEYERFWLRALGPFERVTPREDVPLLERMRASIRTQTRVVEVEEPPAPEPSPAPPAAEPVVGPVDAALSAAARLFAARDGLDRRAGAGNENGGGGVAGLLARIEAALAPIGREELDAFRAEVDRTIVQVEALREQLAVVAALKRSGRA
jgi:hypothetical protein